LQPRGSGSDESARSQVPSIEIADACCAAEKRAASQQARTVYAASLRALGAVVERRLSRLSDATEIRNSAENNNRPARAENFLGSLLGVIKAIEMP
jgi:hypothetical protein